MRITLADGLEQVAHVRLALVLVSGHGSDSGLSSPSSLVFISLEITVSALLVFEVLLRMMAYKRVRHVMMEIQSPKSDPMAVFTAALLVKME